MEAIFLNIYEWKKRFEEVLVKIFVRVHMCVCVLSCVQVFATLWTAGHQARLSMEFSRQEYCSGLPFPTPGNLPNPGIKPVSPASPAVVGRFFTIGPPGKPSVD